jgi:uncharacterized protein (TIGR00730 family)
VEGETPADGGWFEGPRGRGARSTAWDGGGEVTGDIRRMRRVCVFCGSSAGARPEYLAAARTLGRGLAERGVGVVYGGARVGLMGAVADAALAAGGDVTGVIPRALQEREIAHPGLTTLHVVASMHERKALMSEASDAFVTLPGGLGTLEELFEVWTWAQLGIHAKPCGVLNVAGYYTPLLDFLDRGVAEQFVRARYRSMLLVDDDVERLVDRLAAYRPEGVTRWMAPSET